MPPSQQNMTPADQRFKEALLSWDEPGCLLALDNGADPLLKNAGLDASTLSMALRWAMPELASRVLPHSDLLESDGYGWTLLTQAARAGHLQALKAISAVDSPMIARHPGGVTALMCAAAGGSLECVEFLLPLSDLGARDCYGIGPLEFAAKGRSVEILRLFLEAGLPVNPPGHGSNALMIAAERGRLEAVEILLPMSDLRRGSATEGGTSALSLAVENEHWDVADILAEASPLAEALAAQEACRELGGRMAKTEARAAREEALIIEKSTRSAPSRGRPTAGI